MTTVMPNKKPASLHFLMILSCFHLCRLYPKASSDVPYAKLKKTSQGNKDEHRE